VGKAKTKKREKKWSRTATLSTGKKRTWVSANRLDKKRIMIKKEK
jgi:hypothetical protein